MAIGSALGGHRHRPHQRCAGDRVRGKGIARPEQPREPKQSWRAQSRTPGCRDCDSATGLLGGRFRASTITYAWSRAVPRDRCDLDHTVVAWPGVAVISSLPAHALLLSSGASAPPRVANPSASWECGGLSASGLHETAGPTKQAEGEGPPLLLDLSGCLDGTLSASAVGHGVLGGRTSAPALVRRRASGACSGGLEHSNTR